MKTRALALLLIACCGTNSASAQFTTIDFELGAPCSFFQATVLRNEYAALGVQFMGNPSVGSEGGAVLNQCGIFGVNAQSGTDFLAFNENSSDNNGLIPGSPQVITFSNPVGLVQISVAGGAGTAGTFAMSAYDLTGTLLASSMTTTPTGTWVDLSVTAPAGAISKVEISGTDSDSHFVMDDLIFGFGLSTSYCIPEPIAAPCPCGNEPGGIAGNQGCINSTGQGATLIALGSPSLTAANTTLVSTGVPANQFGILFSGFGMAQLPFGDGLRCVTGGIVRSAPIHSGPNAVIRLLDAGNALGGVVGQMRHFQCWYRDPGGPCAASFNLSTAITITFQP